MSFYVLQLTNIHLGFGERPYDIVHCYNSKENYCKQSMVSSLKWKTLELQNCIQVLKTSTLKCLEL